MPVPFAGGMDQPGYNCSVPYRALPVLLFLLTSCAKAPQSDAAIRKAILDHIGKRSDMMAASMRVDVVKVTYREKEADAVVSVAPKEGGSGIQMVYNLAAEGDHWVVKKSGGTAPVNPHGEGAPAPTGALPPGHPAIPPQGRK